MSLQGWTYYQHALIPTTWPHETVNTLPIEDKTIWKVRGGGYSSFCAMDIGLGL